MFKNKIVASLAGFAFPEEVGEVLALAIASGRNVIFFGPAGHGKSEMMKAALGAVDPFVLSFGEGMTEDKIYGGIDFAAMNREEDPVLQYNTKNSFLMKEFAIFEELFDAPSNVLLSLKDTLTAKELRAGAQRVPSKTKLVVALTNKSPAEMADLGPSVQALTERFPLQHEVRWTSYDRYSYREMFEATDRGEGPVTPTDIDDVRIAKSAVTVTQTVMSAYLHLLEDAATAGRPPSPRIARAGLDVIKANAAINGRNEASLSDIEVIRYLGISVANYMEEISKKLRHEKIQNSLKVLESELTELREKMGVVTTPIPALQIMKAARDLGNRVNSVAVTDDLVTYRDSIVKSVNDLGKAALKRAEDVTK